MVEKKVYQYMINIAIALIVGAYGFIFSSVLDRITKVETKVENINPTLMQIQTDIAEIRTNINWIMKK